MAHATEQLSLADRLRIQDPATLEEFLEHILPRVDQAIRREFAPGRLADPEDGVESALRTLWNRLNRRSDGLLEGLEDLRALKHWLIRVAGNKCRRYLRKSRIAAAHQEKLARWEQARRWDSLPADELERIAQGTAEELVGELARAIPAESRPFLLDIYDLCLRGLSDGEITRRLAGQMHRSVRDIQRKRSTLKELLEADDTGEDTQEGPDHEGE